MNVDGDLPLLKLDSWSEDVKTSVNDFVTRYGKGSSGYSQTPYVITDFDNTTCIFDIENQALTYQILTMDFPLDPASFRKATERGTPAELMDIYDDAMAAYSGLYQKYGPFRFPYEEGKLEEITSDDLWKEFSSKAVYLAENITLFDWKVRWLCGHTEEEVYRMCMRSLEKYTAVETCTQTFEGPRGLASKAGPIVSTFVNGLTVTENTKELWKVLSGNGFDIWVCSASEVDQVMAALDFFGLREYVKGVTAKTMRFEDGVMSPEYDYSGKARFPSADGWVCGDLPTRGSCSEEGKVLAIENAIAPLYGGRGPSAAFADSTGDFNFCTEYSSVRLAVVINRADRSVCDGGALLAEMAVCQKRRGLDLEDCISKGDTLYVLQGRSTEGMRCFIPYPESVIAGTEGRRLFKNEDNFRQLDYIMDHGMDCAEVFRIFSMKKNADDADNPLGFGYGFLEEYRGYHSR